MIGLIVMCVRGLWEKEKFLKSFTCERTVIPMVPGEGLLLVAPKFDGYNQKCKNLKQTDQMLPVEKMIQKSNAFKVATIYTVMYKQLGTWKKWIEFADNFDPDMHKND